ncbi:MAG TPA: ABC transporter ATP-binding protein [Sphaerochaeta sp.]|jgi:ATP-binding cassette subfamily B multidrug efflux pump|nr:ABC transporter ATP-binding protein [Spirochaetota bacterium]HOE84479.1 ABC transporter ATP-binding protein [Sphaerochaeta sp.]HOQ94246.1 ABC transporter ATP-binding protein [Sphaerochaeta sp.]HPK47054.1 ABC transporter ATP-binding protein [Sphaerochaeta sp.]HPY11400.1 ABC transporter ATP-binding protein [Sphaerochaeta sp.]
MFRELRKNIQGTLLPTVLTMVFVTLEVVMDVTIPYLMAHLLDLGISAGNMGEVYKWGIILLACSALALTLGVLGGHFAALASTKFARNVRQSLFGKIQGFSFSNIDHFSTASLVTRMTGDVTNVQRSYQMITRIAVRSPAMLIFAFFMALNLNSTLSLIYIVSIPVLGIGLFLLIRSVYPLFGKVFKTYDRLNLVVQENIRGIRVVKSFVREEHETEKFNAVSDSIYRDFSKAEKTMALNSPLMQSTMYFSLIAIFFIAARLIVADRMTNGQLMSFVSYTSQILMSLMMLSMVIVMLTISRASAVRIEEVLAEESDIGANEAGLATVADGSVVFEDVFFSYTKQKGSCCLKNINLTIESGQTVGILGATGSGKTSLVQLIARLYDTTEGTVKVGGHDVRDYQTKALREAVGVVLQKSMLFSGTIAENLRWGNSEASDEELVWAASIAQADSFIKSFPHGYDSYIEQDGSNVSGGQKQRLSIARALLKRPKILILDDSTSAVDTKTDAKIQAALKHELADSTKIVIAQRVSSVIEADQIIILDEGAIHSVGTHEELLASCRLYQELYASQGHKEALS